MTHTSPTEKISNEFVRDTYSRIIAERYDNEYEFNRWFSSAQARGDYFMNYSTILRTLSGQTYKRCLECGPGPGTWTRVLYRHNPQAQFDLVDISETMHEQFKKEMGSAQKNVRYIVTDFMDFTPQEKYDFFFSSRMFEYVEDKDGFIARLHGMLEPKARGIIITKNPLLSSFGAEERKRVLHSAQIDPLDCKKLLEKHGFTDIVCTPAVMRIGANIPGFGIFSVYLSEKLFRKYGGTSLFNSPRFLKHTESYAISFTRP